MQSLEYQPSLAGKSRSPLAELLLLAIPTVLQMATYTLMQFIDTMMLSRLGPSAPAAASQGAMLSFSFISFGMGMVFMVNAFASQAYGRKDYTHCGPILWQGMWFGLAYSLLLAPLVMLAPWAGQFLRHPPQMLHLETIYFQWMIGTTALKLMQVSLAQFMLATNRPLAVTYSAVAGVAVNVAVAYVILVLPHGLTPEEGVRRAAIATAIGVAIEAAVLASFAFLGAGRLKFNTFAWRPRIKEMTALVKVGFGSGVHFTVDIVAWTIFMVFVIAMFGEKAMEANAFMFRYLVLSFLPAVGVSQAVTALVGRYIGAGDTNAAARRAHWGFAVSTTYLALVASVYLLFRRELIEFFTKDQEVVAIGATLMIFCAFYQFADVMFIVYSGALRGAGDTFVPAMATASLCYTIMVGGGWLVGHYLPQFGVAGPWTMASIYGSILGLFMLLRFHYGAWRTRTLNARTPDLDTTASAAGAPIEP